MLSMLQSRIRQYSTPVAAPQPQVAQSPSPAPAPSAPTPGLTASRNTALRTIGGASLFEAAPARTGVSAGPRAKPADVGAPLGIPLVDPLAVQKAAVEKALSGNGWPVDFLNSDGKTEKVSIAQLSFFGQDNYLVRVGDETFQVQFQNGTTADQQAVLAQVIDAYSETPPELRGSLERVVVTPDAGPPAAAGDGTITFYEDAKHLDEGIFHHELAHLIGRQQENSADTFISKVQEAIHGEPPPIPDGWEAAARADGNFTSPYAEWDYDKDGNYTEDFADAWRGYMTALDEGPAAVAVFRAQFPERAEILADLYPGATS